MAEDKRPFPTIVSGVEVIAATFAESDDPRPGRDGQKMQHGTVLHVMLANETEGYLCFHPNGGDCQRVYDNPRSVLAHQKTHSDRMVAKRLQAELDAAKAEKAKAETELAQTKQRRSEQAKRAAATRNANAKQAARSVMQPAAPVNPMALLADAIEHEIEMVRDDLTDVRITLDRAVEHLNVLDEKVKLLRATPAVDPTIVEKARRYDILTTSITQPIK